MGEWGEVLAVHVHNLLRVVYTVDGRLDPRGNLRRGELRGTEEELEKGAGKASGKGGWDTSWCG